MVAPSLTETQRQFGASVSLALRRARAELKAYIRVFGDRDPAGVIDTAFVRPIGQGMKVKSLLLALPGIGPKRAEQLLTAAGLTANRSVRSLGPKQRERLLAVLATRR